MARLDDVGKRVVKQMWIGGPQLYGLSRQTQIRSGPFTDPHHEVFICVRVIDPPCSTEPSVVLIVWWVWRIVDDPHEGVFTRPVTLWWHAGRVSRKGITSKSVQLILPGDRQNHRQA